ncbi:hypothetical protein OKA04_15240 [Luteolibacter flavescens]|uniref:PH domain-containing protein n=1 Tax=Luteolibacter flavescens TaxID=1859460 RepID=A0ABT3FR82_9BACT|nr:hypothetical protein [Luteolibacter flavescens]MCW1886092.1 hypothetical protein [Luteolibacter flavescens]
MPSSFQLQTASRRKWELTGAIILTVVFTGYLVASRQDPGRLPLAVMLGICAILKWVRWHLLARALDAWIGVDDSGIHFSPPDFWKVEEIRWDELTGMKVGRRSIWLAYRQNGMERNRDISRADLATRDEKDLLALIGGKLPTSGSS